ncbi:efflux RND transporter permease subunit [Alkalicoccus urumqiensis]|uniref:AcrB/AcrD/AcrF family protein n=1 Tax=Alkalicoccus urumqiensis TaxID=1548213 RepID=A0A2P6MI54_ALKUR|nr:efflux RND transporter permease subunit [Alkalicoccus urumqiensis]PRO65961.1 AcrB/AcrD/AcrF family protein [Alkalicoccus urumqiensis]
MYAKVIERPKITLMFVLIFIVLGVLTLFQLPQREVPEISVNVSIISTPYPGGSPEEVEQQVTVPLEDAVEGIDGISSINSVSTAGFSSVTMEIEDGTPVREVTADIDQAVADTEGDLPETAVPSVSQAEGLGALSSYHILGDSYEELYELRDTVEEWASDVEGIPGVSGVTVKGFPDQQYLIDLDGDALAEAGIQIPDVISAIEGELSVPPLGVQENEAENVQLKLETLESPEAVDSIAVGTSPQGDTVFLEDVASSGVNLDTPDDRITFEGTPALSFTVLPEPGESIPQLHEAVDDRMQTLAEDLPENATLDLFYTQQTIVEEIFGDLALSFALAAVSVIVVTLLGLNVSSAVIVALAIPVSVFIGLIPLPFAGVDLNQISIIGLIVALGILVDDAIVVGDNIRNKYRGGLGAVEGALEGVREVRVSIIVSTLTIVFTFLPLVFISGSNGSFIRALPTTLITTIIASTLVALTLVPIFLIWRRKKQEARQSHRRESDGFLGKPLTKLADWYSDTLLRKVVRHPWKTAIAGLALTTAFYGLVPFIPVEFFPSTDRDEVTVEVRMPAGTTLQETESVLEDMRDDILDEDSNVYETAVYAGEGLPPLFGQGQENTGEETGNLLLRVNREDQSALETISRWTDPLQDSYPDAEIELTTIEAGPPVGAPVALTLTGPEVETLMDISADLQEDIRTLEESGTVLDDLGPRRPALVYEPVAEEMEEAGLTRADISEQIGLRTEGIPLLTFRSAEETIDLQLTQDRIERGESINLEEIEVPAASAQDGPPELISLATLVTEQEEEIIPQIIRADGDRTVTVRVFPAVEDTSGLENQIEEIIAETETEYDEAYAISLGGETDARSDFILELATLFVLVLFLIYIVIAIQFYSLTIPFLVLSTVHIAASGAMVGLFLTQTGLGFTALLGIVSLSGIVVRNSIVLLEFIKQRRLEGMGLQDAVVEAGRVRLRPILLTAFTAIGALTPVALGGDVLFQPLAVSIIAGLIFSALLTVIIVPALYTAFAQTFGTNPRKARR